MHITRFLANSNRARKLKREAESEDAFRALKTLDLDGKQVNIQVSGWTDSGFTVKLVDYGVEFKHRHKTILLDMIEEYLNKNDQ